MDVHIPRAITDGLRRRGVDVLTAQEDSRRTVGDEYLLHRANELGRVMVSADEDFTMIAAQWQRRDIAFVGIVRMTQNPFNIGLYVHDLELVAKIMEVDELANVVTFIPF